MVNIPTQTEPNMKATGLMINSMGKEKNNGQTELNTKVIIEMVKSMGKEF